MDKKFGIVMFEGRMYNLDEMNADELKELMMRIGSAKNMKKKEIEILNGIYKTNDKEEVDTDERQRKSKKYC